MRKNSAKKTNARKTSARKTSARKTSAKKTNAEAIGTKKSSGTSLLEKIRQLALALPDTKLTMTWGQPHFRVGEKIFCGFGEEKGRHILGVKLAPLHARELVQQGRFWPAPYVGKHGWVSMDVTQRKSWGEVAALIRESYRLIAPKASLAKLR